METEKRIVEYALESKFEDLPKEPVESIKTILLAELGAMVAGADVEECQKVVSLVKEWGGKQEATILVHNVKVPACNAAMANGTMGRALDFEEAMLPGIHIGPVSVPASLAAVELAGGCSGKEFLTSLILGTEITSRLNKLNIKDHVGTYNGFDPVGICAIFAGTAAAGRIMGLNSAQMLNALALVFNRAGGSYQSNIDGAQSVAFIAGSGAQSSVICAQLAQRGFTGPHNFLEGDYGYFHLYAHDNCNTQTVVGELGKKFNFINTLFKQYPSCGLTQASTQAILELIRDEGITPENVSSISVWVQPFTHRQVGHFEIGDSPRQNAQFSIPYCIANALLRKSSQLQHFEESYIREPKIRDIIKKIEVISTPAMEKRDMTAMDMEVKTKEGTAYRKSIDTPRGFPGNEMTKEEHIARFRQCVNYGAKPWREEKIEKVVSTVDRLEEVKDVRSLISLCH